MNLNVMRKIISLTIWAFTFIFSACFQESFTPTVDSIYKESIVNFLDNLKLQTHDNSEKQKVENLVDGIDFKNIKTYDLKGTEELLITDISKIDGFESQGVLKAIFFINQGELVRSNIVEFSNYNPNHNELIVSILNFDFNPEKYSGKVTFYNPYQVVHFFNVFENGKLVKSGNLNRNRNHNTTGGRANACIDWYLVTTYYYSDGSKRTTDQYLFTTCDDECNTTRIASGRVKCGGGGETPGTGAPLFPSNPQDGEEYEFTNKDGIKTIYKYDSQNNAWTVFLVTLADVVVQSQPQTYPYLLTDGPSHGLTVLGPDNFLYVYDAWYASWEAQPMIVIAAPGDSITNISDYLKCFNLNSGGKVTIYVEQPRENSSDTWAGNFWNPRVGHTFISIQQGGITRVFGFYPSDGVSPLDPAISSVLVDDGGHNYHVSIEITVNSTQLTNVINAATNYSSTYNLNNYNCTDFGISIAAAAGVNLPDTYGSWSGGGGSNPGNLGQDIRGMSAPTNSTTNTNGGTAPTNSGSCN